MTSNKKFESISASIKNKIGKFDKKSIIGFILLLSPYVVGVITRQSASIDNTLPKRFPTCDSFIHGLCIPTIYVPVPLGVGFLVINLTSFLLSASLFLAGYFIVKKKSNSK
ncbi:MAG: hypothetical protein WA833_08695 [Nitrosotalea sp.]